MNLYKFSKVQEDGAANPVLLFRSLGMTEKNATRYETASMGPMVVKTLGWPCGCLLIRTAHLTDGLVDLVEPCDEHKAAVEELAKKNG